MLNSFFNNFFFNKLKIGLYGKKRNLNLRKFKQNNFKSLKDYLSRNSYETGLCTIWFDNIPLDMIFQFKAKSNPLFVFFHGGVDQYKTVIPHFVGLSYKNMVSANMLHVADPSLVFDKNIRAGWYLGWKNNNLQDVLVKIINRLSEYIGSQRLIFFGSSGGGFPSLCLGQFFSDSITIVNSPATSVRNHPHRKTRVSNYLKAAFETVNVEEENKILEDFVISDMHENFDINTGTILYLLNINDTVNINQHATPFFSQFSQKVFFDRSQVQRIGNLILVTDDWGPGHRYPPAKLLKQLFTYVKNDEMQVTVNHIYDFLSKSLNAESN